MQFINLPFNNKVEVYFMLVGVDGSEGNIVPPFSLIPLPGINHHIPIIFPGKMLCAGFSSDFSFIFPLTVLNVHPIVQCPQNTFPTFLNLNIIHGKSMNPVPPSLSPVVVFACQFKGGGPLSLAPTSLAAPPCTRPEAHHQLEWKLHLESR